MTSVKRRRSGSEEDLDPDPEPTLQEKYETALTIIKEACGWTEEKVVQATIQGTNEFYENTFISLVKEHHKCVCAFIEDVKRIGLHQYHKETAAHYLPFSVFSRFIAMYDNQWNGCPLKFWNKDICCTEIISQLCDYYENRQKELANCFDSKHQMMIKILDYIEGEYQLLDGMPVLSNDLRNFLLRYFLSSWYRGKCLDSFQKWFPKVYCWQDEETMKNVRHWFTETEWSQMVEWVRWKSIHDIK